MYNDIEWTYKGHKCLIEFDVEEDNVKAFHYVTTPNGSRHMLDISPYDTNEKTVENIIDRCIHGNDFDHAVPSKAEVKHYES